jgi:broad specificity phosphatase PhoE
MAALILCRHGRTDWNDLGRYQGQTDVPLNDLGRKQAEFLAQTLRAESLSAVWSSDLARASETAVAIARLQGLQVRQDARLREIDQGRWEGLTVPQIRERDAVLHDLWESSPLEVTLPGGESIDQVRRRTLAAVCDAIRERPDGLICFVTHKVVQTIVRCELTGEPLERALRRLPANASFERVDVPLEFVQCCAQR